MSTESRSPGARVADADERGLVAGRPQLRGQQRRLSVHGDHRGRTRSSPMSRRCAPCPAPTRSASTPAAICCAARTPKETEEYYHYLVREKGDWEAAEQIIAKRAAGGSQSLSPELMRKDDGAGDRGGATFPVIGSYDEVAEKFLRLSNAGLDGMAVILVNYVNEMPVLRDEVLPRLERLKLRAGAATMRRNEHECAEGQIRHRRHRQEPARPGRRQFAGAAGRGDQERARRSRADQQGRRRRRGARPGRHLFASPAGRGSGSASTRASAPRSTTAARARSCRSSSP